MGFEKKSKPLARAYRSSAQTIANSTPTAISFDGQTYDTDAMFAPTDTKIYAKRFSGYYLIIGQVLVDAGTAGYKTSQLRVNGSTLISAGDGVNAAGTFKTLMSAAPWYLNVNDYVELLVTQYTGTTMNTVGGPDLTWLSVAHFSGR